MYLNQIKFVWFKKRRLPAKNMYLFYKRNQECVANSNIFLLQEPFFSLLIKRAHPSCNITEENCSLALNFLRGTLRYVPENRPSATQVLQHPLLQKSVTLYIFSSKMKYGFKSRHVLVSLIEYLTLQIYQFTDFGSYCLFFYEKYS